jgi:hypothetical protein
MDPYLEGTLWPDVHSRLAVGISNVLGPLVRPNYVVRTEISTVRDTEPESEIGIMYPDLKMRRSEQAAGSGQPAAVAEPPVAPVVIQRMRPVTVRIVTAQVREVLTNDLVTVIEVISPANKHRPGLEEYAAKRLRLVEAGVHLLEIDLVRRGQRAELSAPPAPYLVTLIRAGADQLEAWPLTLRDPLPVPLRDPHPAVSFDLQRVLDDTYSVASYELSIDYDREPPPPALSSADLAWVRERVGAWKSSGVAQP